MIPMIVAITVFPLSLLCAMISSTCLAVSSPIAELICLETSPVTASLPKKTHHER